MLTGKHAARLRITIWSEASQKATDRKLLEGQSHHDLPHTETTLAKRLQSAGYLTALVGKWHLGDADHYPERTASTSTLGGPGGRTYTHFWPYSGAGRFGGEFRYVPHLEFGKPGEYLADRLTDEAISVIDRAGGQPSLLYLAHHAVHTPIEARAADVQHFADKRRPDSNHRNVTYAAMVKSLDESVGRVMDHLKKRGSKKTRCSFSPATTAASSAAMRLLARMLRSPTTLPCARAKARFTKEGSACRCWSVCQA